MKKLLFASNNQGKIKEVKHLLAPLNYTVIPQSDFNIPAIAETGLSFVENAILKARHAASLTGLPCLADDSGLTVDILNGAPGIYSARYAGDNASDNDNITRLLTRLADVPIEQRRASFHCVLALLRDADDPIPIICHGQWTGLIIDEAKGEHGFGYDPIFYLPEQGYTAAQLSLTVKNSISHRGQALQQLVKQLTEVAL